MKHKFRICPSDKLVIEWRLLQQGARWGFFKICDSPNHAKATLATLQGKVGTTETEEEEDG